MNVRNLTTETLGSSKETVACMLALCSVNIKYVISGNLPDIKVSKKESYVKIIDNVVQFQGQKTTALLVIFQINLFFPL